MQGRLDVQRAYRRRGGQSFGDEPARVRFDRHELDAEPRGQCLQHRIGERFDGEPLADRDEGGERGRDRLAPVAGEQHRRRVRPPVATGEQPGRRFTRGRRARRADRMQRRGEDVGAQQRLERLRERRGLAGQDGEVEFEVDPRVAGFRERGLRGRLGRADERAAPDLADGQSTPDQLAVHPGRGGVRDAALAGESALRG